MTSALVVDDHPIVFQGCRRVLEDLGVDTIHEATSVTAGYRAFLRQRPDMVVVDLTLDGDDLGGIALIQRIKSAGPKTRVLVLSMHNDPTIVARAIDSGAAGYALKDMPAADLIAAFEKVLGGETYLDHKLAMQVAMLRATEDRTSPLRILSEREKQILSLLGRGHGYDQIALKLGVSYKTIANTASQMKEKLKIDTLAGLIRFAIANDSDTVPSKRLH